MAYTIEELRKRSDEELIQDHDSRVPQYGETPFLIREELARRTAKRPGDLMVKLTLVITVLTAAILILTLVNVWAVFLV